MDVFRCFFLYFKLCQPASFEPLDQLKAYTHHFKALEIGNLNEDLKMGVKEQNIWLTQ